MKSLKLSPGKFPKKVILPASKSYANRALIIAAQSDSPFTVHDLPDSTDVTFLVAAFEQIGIRVTRTATSVTLLGPFPKCEKQSAPIKIGEGGTTARFLAALLLRGTVRHTLVLGDRLRARPWQEFIDLVNTHGGRAELIGDELSLQGPVTFPPVLEVDCRRTTQFASGIQLAFPEISVVPKQLESSESYWKMTSELQKTMQNSSSYRVPLDWSSASYPLAFGALNHEIFFPDLQPDAHQADGKFFDLLSRLNLVTKSPEGISVFSKLIHQDIEMDVSDALDLVPALSFFLAHIPGSHRLHGISNLVHKESDRLAEVIKLLRTFDRSASSESGSLSIQGHSIRRDTPVDLTFPDDHRMVMTGALFLRHHAGGTISPVSAVSKSYPRFFELLDLL